MFILIVFSCYTSHGQFFEQDFEKINTENKKKARKFLSKCQSNNIISYFLKLNKNKKNTYYPVASYYISKEVSDYDSTDSILGYLIFDQSNPLDDFIAIQDKTGYYVGCDKIFFENDNKYFSYEGMRKIYIHEPFKVNLNNSFAWPKVLSKHNFKFLFSIKEIKNCIFFIENENVILLDLTTLKTYDINEYFSENFSILEIQGLGGER